MEERCIAPRHQGFAYNRPNSDDHTLDEQLPFVPFIAISGDPESTIAHDLGALENLPAELLGEVLYQLDLRTFTDFLRVNRRASSFVKALPQYKAITTHAPNTIIGILRLRTGERVTCKLLYEKLCTSTCEYCGDFGGYLYLITCRRVCFLCFTQERAYLPLNPRVAARILGLDINTIPNLPQALAVPGLYSCKAVTCRQGIYVDYDGAVQAAITRHGSLEATRTYVADAKAKAEQAHQEHMNAMGLAGSWLMQLPAGEGDTPDEQSSNPLRFVAIVRVPWVDRAAGEVEWGFSCRWCKGNGGSIPRGVQKRRQYTNASFDEHLSAYGAIRDGKHCPDDS